MKGQVAEQNYWPGYLDALINVMLNLLFLVAVFAIGLLLLNVQTMSQQRQLSVLGAGGGFAGGMDRQIQEVMDELGMDESEKARLSARLDRLDVQAMVERRRLLGQRSEQVEALQEKVDAQKRAAELEQQRAQAQAQAQAQALAQAQAQAQAAQEAKADAAALEAAKKRIEEKTQQLAEHERELKDWNERVERLRRRMQDMQASQGQQAAVRVIDLRVAGRALSERSPDIAGLLRQALGASPQAIWEYAPEEFAWSAGKPLPAGYATADRGRAWTLVGFADLDNPRVLRESFARANAAREWMVRDGHARAQIKVELKSASQVQGLGERAYRQVYLVATQ